MSTLPALWLDHLNLPASDPELLAQWYSQRLGLEQHGNRAIGPGITLFFTPGLPLRQGDRFHFGFRVESRSAVEAWAQHLGVAIAYEEEDFFAARLSDPEGNTFEIYWNKM
jgi:catechol 2,3-dioxygenase-like lactoylglutathione lyase family enzyme